MLNGLEAATVHKRPLGGRQNGAIAVVMRLLAHGATLARVGIEQARLLIELAAFIENADLGVT